MMKCIVRHIMCLLWLAAFAVSAVSCIDGALNHYANRVCHYTVQLRYDYNEENTNHRNMITYYVYTIDEYIFDEDGILFQYRRFVPDPCTGSMNAELNLPPGRYSVIAIGNQDERSECSDRERSSEPIPGTTHRDDMLLTLNNCEKMAGDTRGASEKLYYGYKTFTVAREDISRVRVDMVNAHLRLRFRVTWKNGATPPNGSNYYALLGTIPGQYRLMPQYIYPIGSFECQEHNCDTHDMYPTNCNHIIHHIPYTCYDTDHTSNHNLWHRTDTKITVDKEMWGEFIIYRVKMATEPVLRIFNSNTTRNDADEQIIRDINLRQYFEWYDYQPDQTLKQDYEIDIQIDGDKIMLMPLNVSDWEEGEALNS